MQTDAFTNAAFISDLHLTEDRPDCTRAFFSFLNWLPETTEALFILGDFFEYWVGDDVKTSLSQEVAKQLLKTGKSKSIAIYFLPGNRDFAIGKAFCQQAGMILITDNDLFTIAGNAVVLCHGDLLCSDDKSYQRFRKIIRHPLVMNTLLHLPVSLRVKLAEQLRLNSKNNFKKNPVYIDVTSSAVKSLFNETKANILVHGHTHMADIHLYGQENETESRMVLGDWHQVGWYGTIDENGSRLHQFDINHPEF